MNKKFKVFGLLNVVVFFVAYALNPDLDPSVVFLFCASTGVILALS